MAMNNPTIRAGIALAFCAAMISTPIAQTPGAADSARYGWSRQVNGLLNLSQAYYDNWAKGGDNAFAYEWNLSASAALKRENFEWNTNAKAIYGRTKLGSLGSRKSSDQFNFETVYTRLLKIHVNPFASATAQSQFMPGYAYPEGEGDRSQISDYFNPAYFTETIGLGIEPIKDLKERLGATMKQTVGSYGFQAEGVRTGEDFKQEYGISSITEYARTVMENVQASTRLDVFVNFKGVKHIDARWANQLTAKVNKLLSVNFEYERLYDSDLSESAQTRQALTVGISFLSL